MKKLPALLLLLAFSYTSSANTFIVTSTADSGPGTLRESITMANTNGTAVIDTIEFNLTDLSTAGRRITLISELPDLSSNIIIDGTTQPGTKFGLSDAKVELFFSFPTGNSQVLLKIYNCSNIGIYGLKLTDDIAWTAWYKETICIRIENSNNIEIGSIGKGNVLVNWIHALVGYPKTGTPNEGTYNKNIRIYSNFFGLLEDGLTAVGDGDLLTFAKIENIDIGNLDPRSGNILAATRKRIEIGNGTKGTILIANNKIGTNYFGTEMLSKPYGESSHIFDNISILNSPWVYEIEYGTQVKIINNILTGYSRAGIYLIGIGKKFYIQGNKIGTDITGTKRLSPLMDYGIWISNCRAGIIGAENNEKTERNIIAFGQVANDPYSGGCGILVYTCPSGITISRNSIFCDQNKSINQAGTGQGVVVIPVVTINTISSTSVSGTAPPLSKIELFRDDTCVNCEVKNFFDTAQADATGYWFKNNVSPANIVVTATDTGGMTSEASAPLIKLNNFKITDATCGKKNGSITGVNIISGTWWQWEDANGAIISKDSVLQNVGSGFYRLVVGIGSNSCNLRTSLYEIHNINPPDALTPSVRSASCGQSKGAVSVSFDVYSFNGKWINSNNDSVGSGANLNNVLPGNYSFQLFASSDRSCTKTYGPFIVPNASGPSLSMATIQINAATCGNNTGSIKGITAVNTQGNVFIRWLDSLNNYVGSNFDLINVPAGKYRLKCKDNSGCDTIVTPFYIIPNNGALSIDTTGLKVMASKCSGVTGSITQIRVNGADSYQWINTSTNTIVGTSPDVFNLPSGNYQLIVKNILYGCTKSSPVIFIPQSVFIPLTVTSSVTTNATCSQNNGSIVINSFNNNSSAYTFTWTNNSVQTAGNTFSLFNLAAGNYQLSATDSNGCEKMIFSSPVLSSQAPIINYAQIQIKNDECSLQVGSISSLQINGLIGPTTYTWYDQNNNASGNNINLQHAGAGIYVLKITDGITCTVRSDPFTIINNNVSLTAPVYDNVLIPRYSDITISNKNPATGTYSLSVNATGMPVLQQSITGNFKINSIASDTTFYVQRISGSCTSPVVSVNIKVVDKSYFAIPNAFTPNGDNKNDILPVKVIGYIELKSFKIYNRFGELVFQTNKINDGWNGKYKGVLQEVGVFVWVADGKDINGKSITDHGNFTLLR
jgi:gliding motility-associated-like protein